MDRPACKAAEHRLRVASVSGLFTLAMAARAGFTRAAIRHRTASGAWRHVVGHAYLAADVCPEAASVRHRATAAELTWPGAIICLRTAALLFGLPVRDDGAAHVLVRPGRRPMAGMRPHSFQVAPSEIATMGEFRVTSRRRTVLDCLSLLPRDEAERLMAWVRTRELLDQPQLERAVEARSGTRGVPQLRALVTATADGALSRLEQRAHLLLQRSGITGWAADQRIVVAGQVVARADILFAAQRVIVELDGRAHHEDFERERSRLNTLTLAGYTVLRFTWHQITRAPDQVIDQIRTALRQADPLLRI